MPRWRNGTPTIQQRILKALRVADHSGLHALRIARAHEQARDRHRDGMHPAR
jgi:hypothetical protein